MSKKQDIPTISYGDGYLVQQEMPNYLIGRLLTLVDALGLKESQEKSVKDLVRQEVWNSFDQMYVPVVPHEINDAVHKWSDSWRQRMMASDAPLERPGLKVTIEEIKD